MPKAIPADTARIVSINVGRARLIAANGRTVSSAIGKRAVEGPVEVRPLGLEGDEQADPSVHGGLSKAVYAYPNEHYKFWQTVRAQAQLSLWDDPLEPGFLGENLTLTGLDEGHAFIGDLLRFPECALAVSEPRLPCFKFNAVMGFSQASKLMAQSGWCGFYLAVRTPGVLRAGDVCDIVPGPREVSIAEVFRSRMGRDG